MSFTCLMFMQCSVYFSEFLKLCLECKGCVNCDVLNQIVKNKIYITFAHCVSRFRFINKLAKKLADMKCQILYIGCKMQIQEAQKCRSCIKIQNMRKNGCQTLAHNSIDYILTHKSFRAIYELTHALYTYIQILPFCSHGKRCAKSGKTDLGDILYKTH